MAKRERQVYTFGGNSVALPARYALALKRRLEGLTLRELGQELGGVSRERARQLLDRAARQVKMQFKSEGKSAEAAAEFLNAAPLWGLAGPEE